MTVVALVISIFALAAAAVSAWYARTISRVEKGRRHDEMQPSFVLDGLTMESSLQRGMLRIRHAAGSDIDGLSVQILGVGDTSPILTIQAEDGEPFASTTTIDRQMQVGDVLQFRFEASSEFGGKPRLRIESRLDKDTWVSLVD